VLIPLLFMGDVVGRLFREFAITLAVTILISAVVSLTLTPMMCARCCATRRRPKQGRFYRGAALLRPRDRTATAHARLGARPPGATLLVALGTLALTVLLYIVMPKGFFPVQDTGVIQGISEAPQSISFAAMAERQQALARACWRTRRSRACPRSSASTAPTTLNSGRMLINLKPLASATPSATEVIRRLQPSSRRWRASRSTCSRCRT
jgi:multidrug efflux pump